MPFVRRRWGCKRKCLLGWRRGVEGVPGIRQEHAAAPDTQSVHPAVDGGLDELGVRFGRHPSFELLHLVRTMRTSQ